ncbi:MAG: ATP-binding protein [Ignavibacteriaceae bacterium]|nr:ATP-binding protein [Ignavibacteriaceae bacterium]
MKKTTDLNIDEFLNNFSGIFYWRADSDISSIKYSNNVSFVTGYKSSEIEKLEYGWLSLIIKEDLPSYRKKLDEFEKNPDLEIIKLDYRIAKKDGSIVQLSERIRVLRGSNSNILNRFGLIFDITDYAEVIEDLKAKKEQLELLNSSKDSFISVLSHDLRAPFTSILGFSEIILNENMLPEKDKAEYVKFIYDSSNNQLQLVNHLFDWSQIQTGRVKTEMQRLHGQSIAYNCVSYLTGQAMRKNIHISVKIPDSFYIDADERLITKVFMNLISNAIKYSFENESVEISANIYNNDLIEFVVKDKGAGISEVNQEKIFNIAKLFSTEGTKGEKGSGLGLMLAKQIVEKHGGEMWFFSAEGKGSEFHFTLPAATSYILLVFDDTKKLDELESGLSKDYPTLQVLKAENAFEALEIISAKFPSLVIIEHNLPLMDGLQLISAVREKHKHIRIPFIVFLDSVSEMLIRSYQDFNVKILKQKPSLNEQLKDKIESLLYN